MAVAADDTPAARRLAVGTTPAPNGALHRSHTPASPLATLTTPGMLRVGARGATVARPSRRRSAAARSIPDEPLETIFQKLMVMKHHEALSEDDIDYLSMTVLVVSREIGIFSDMSMSWMPICAEKGLLLRNKDSTCRHHQR
ncbi:hypothetical protein CHLRE_22g753747v5 [Chlamydomonas reinhardtii]|uniref:Uncharacterized protein n=1 Tax=Chlamydomonas reinhardtii TaxID=3055 RepID=A0A2K3CN71_CHLRE|nr:uncharacterized protein CHLRE_22g753747v5 [Chlamydomonas reinhardtii]PNW69734.1 hypothetical protein CHLRE_22g753747v5 [Chlamydomonas reinhardtii]